MLPGYMRMYYTLKQLHRHGKTDRGNLALEFSHNYKYFCRGLATAVLKREIKQSFLKEKKGFQKLKSEC